MTGHPTRSRLEAFTLGRLSASESVDIELHLSDCETCRIAAEAAPPDTLVARLQRLPQESSPDIATAAWSEIPPGVTAGYNQSRSSTILSAQLAGALADHPRYRVLESLGHGGMGEVFKAEHMVMQRLVALKTIRPELLGDSMMFERFQREVEAASRLSHPNVVTAYDAERVGATHFLVMEYVQGSALGELVTQSGPLSIPVACDYICQVAQGLQHAYECGMVHRDIKPQNLMVTSGGVVKILDFGLARLRRESVTLETVGDASQDNICEELGYTSAGTVMGTPDFMAPEQATDAHTADIRSDIYSLGCTLYYLLSGRPPFAGTRGEKLAAHRQQPPPPLKALVSGLPPQLGTIVAKMMAKSPAERYQTPAELVKAVEPFADLAAQGRRRRVHWAWAIGIVSAMAAALVVYALVRERAPEDLNSPNRRAAEWVLNNGGSVGVKIGDNLVEAWDARSLPPRAFKLARINMSGLKVPLNAELAVLDGLDSCEHIEMRDCAITDEGLAHFHDMKGLAELILHQTRITDAGLAHIAGLSNLNTLHLGNNGISDAGMIYLAKLKKLRSLELHYTLIGDEGVAHLNCLSELEVLYLSGTRLTDAGLAVVERMPKLKRLHLVGTQISDAGLIYLLNLPQLQSLQLNGDAITDAGLDQLAKITSLLQLSLRQTRVTAAGVDRLRHRLTGCRIDFTPKMRAQSTGKGDVEKDSAPAMLDTKAGNIQRRAALWVLGRGGRLSIADAEGNVLPIADEQILPQGNFEIREIHLSGRVTAGLRAFPELAGLTTVRRLRLDGAGVPNSVLADLQGMTALEHLSLDYAKVTDEGLEQLRSLPALHTLSIYSVPISDAGLERLARFPSLQALYAGKTRISDRAPELLQSLKLVTLSVTDTPFTDAGVERLTLLPELRWLHLSNTKVTDKGLDYLKRLPKLEFVDLAQTGISDAGLDRLAHVPTIRRVRLSQTLVSEAGIRRLRAALPKCEVER